MIKYTIHSDGNYVTFVGVIGTDQEGTVNSFRKELVRNVVANEYKQALLIADSDAVTTEYKYFEVQSPYGEYPFPDLISFRQYLIEVLNSESLDSDRYLGSWDAINNYPVLEDGAMYDSNDDGIVDTKAPNAKYFVVVNASELPEDNTMLDGENHWAIGDLVVSTGTKWSRILRITEIAAWNVAYENNTDCADDPVWCNIDNVQQAIDNIYSRTSDFEGSLESLRDVDVVDSETPNGYALIFEADLDPNNIYGGKWKAKKIVGHVLYKINYWLDGTIDPPEFTTEGNYVLTTGNTASWIPSYVNNDGDTVKADVNDIVNYTVQDGWTVVRDASEEEPGSMEILFIYNDVYGTPGTKNIINANYVWDGTDWTAVDAYEPNENLERDLEVANPNLGDISVPPYSAPTLTVGDLEGRSISKILDDIMFTTIPYEYKSPILSVATQAKSYERGTTLSGNVSATYTIRDGGNLDSTDGTWIGNAGDHEIELHVVMDGTDYSTDDDSHVAGNRSISRDISDIQIPSLASTGVVGTFSAVARTADGPIRLDNKGGETPRNAGYGGDTLAMTLTKSANYYSRYPIWYGTTTEAFTLKDKTELTDITIGPNEGSNIGGTHLNNNWLQNTWSSKKHLFISNVSGGFTTANGIVHGMIVCPPGITIASFEIKVVGSWVDAVYDVEDIPDITSLAGDEPRIYKCYYTRDTANGTFQGATEFRFTTTGTIQP